MISIEGIPLMKPPYGTVTALDLVKGTMVWQTAHGETPDAIKNHPLLKGVTIPRTGQSGILGTLSSTQQPYASKFFLSYASMKTLPERLAPQSAAKSFLTVSACWRLTARFEGKPASRILYSSAR